MIQPKIPRMDKMTSRIARSYITEGYTIFKMTLSEINITKVFHTLKLFQGSWPRKRKIEIRFNGGYLYFDRGKIGFYLEDMNHHAFKRLCKMAENLNINLDNFDVSDIIKKRKHQLKSTKSVIEDLINEIIRDNP